jgi:hypothetical protein
MPSVHDTPESRARKCLDGRGTLQREGRRWILDEYGPGEEAVLESLGIRLEVDAVYFDPLAASEV